MGHPRAALKIVFGSMTLGKQGADQARVHDLEECAAIIDTFQEFGIKELDSARSYCEGSCEEYLSRLDMPGRGIVVGTKLSPMTVNSLGTKGHGPESLRQGLLDSLKALGAAKVDLWYLHQPDHGTPYEDTLREVNRLYTEGYFRRFGISNFSAWETTRICEICIHNGWKRPDVYQGVYNALHRSVEPELFPCLRHYGIAFYQYNPLAGGILTDHYQRSDVAHEEGSRFDPARKQGALYRGRYWRDEFFDALDVVRPVAHALGITTAEAALRWSLHHSSMSKEAGDAVIIGASSAAQLRENLLSTEKGPLPDELVEAFDRAYDKVKGHCHPYFK
ncbi:Aflatoxin B1 aldehyde reductase member 3 [Escovopsis weberi]|uniref:Aflatoxin B1 aldehyde reductase member 3 n=1 Tax=Escovopsis weberi TaxID=150374 RepID=A0A0M9VVQ2_ESCWE|nr:Aflatoxin B1 aldehyde reductase member 3 [Escovopsis weberi]